MPSVLGLPGILGFWIAAPLGPVGRVLPLALRQLAAHKAYWRSQREQVRS
jgi:hypothetical protein